jgi:hypothetical protein
VDVRRQGRWLRLPVEVKVWAIRRPFLLDSIAAEFALRKRRAKPLEQAVGRLEAGGLGQF